MKEKWIIGIDEAGRGPLAGPLLVGAVSASESFVTSLNLTRDSKGLSPKKREEWYWKIVEAEKSGKLKFSFCSVPPQIIDKEGLTLSIEGAVGEVVNDLASQQKIEKILLDGGLKAPVNFLQQESIIKGDEKVPIIGLASVVAKVIRDQQMLDLAVRYPHYGLENHKGYATEEHYLALLTYGRSEIHRKSFTRFLG